MPEPTKSTLSRRVRRRWRKLKEWWRFMPEANREMIRGGLVAAIFCGGAFMLWHFGMPVWLGWKQRQARAKTEAVAGRDEHRNAVLEMRRATDAAPGDPRVWREAATYLARVAAPEAVLARQPLAKPDVSDLGRRVALVTEAMRLAASAAPADGLAALEKADRDDPAFYRLAAALAPMLGQAEDFERRLETLAGAGTARLGLAALRAWSVDEAVSSRAYRELVALTDDPELRVRAALERLRLAAAKRDSAKLAAEVAALLPVFDPQARGAAPADDAPGEAPGWSRLLGGLKAAARDRAGDTAVLARWLGGLDMGQSALAWTDTLPADLRSSSAVAGAAADLAARLNDMPRLRRLLAEGAWGRMPPEAIDLAIATRVQRLRFGEQRGRTTWEDAVNTARDSLEALRALARLAGAWGDLDGADRALQTVVDRFPREYWACDALRVSYASQRDTDKLWRLYKAWAPRVPDDKPVQQTWIMLGALLNRSEPEHLRRAEEMLRSEGERPELTTQLAVVAARWRAGRVSEADAVLGAIPAEAHAEPRVVLWEAVLAAGRDDAAMLEEALGRLPREKLMREEQQVLTNALAENSRRRRAAERAAARLSELLATTPVKTEPGAAAKPAEQGAGEGVPPAP